MLITFKFDSAKDNVDVALKAQLIKAKKVNNKHYAIMSRFFPAVCSFNYVDGPMYYILRYIIFQQFDLSLQTPSVLLHK